MAIKGGGKSRSIEANENYLKEKETKIRDYENLQDDGPGIIRQKKYHGIDYTHGYGMVNLNCTTFIEDDLMIVYEEADQIGATKKYSKYPMLSILTKDSKNKYNLLTAHFDMKSPYSDISINDRFGNKPIVFNLSSSERELKKFNNDIAFKKIKICKLGLQKLLSALERELEVAKASQSQPK